MGFEMKCVPVLDHMPCCCCSCDLKVGTLVLGWFSLITNIGLVLRYAAILVFNVQSADKPPYEAEEYFIVGIVMSALSLLVVIPLLYGAHTEKPVFMLPCIIYDLIALVGVAALVVIGSIISFIANIFLGLGILIFGGLFTVLCAFFWMVIYSYYRKLEERRYPGPASCLDNEHTGKV